MISELFLYNLPERQEIDDIIASDELLQVQIDNALDFYEQEGWVLNGRVSTVDSIRQIMSEGRRAWEEFRELSPHKPEIDSQYSKVNQTMQDEERIIGLLAVEVHWGDRLVLSAARSPGRRSLVCQFFDSEVAESLPEPQGRRNFDRGTGSSKSKTLFRGYQVEIPCSPDFDKIPRGHVEKVFDWLRSSLIAGRNCQERLVHLEPLRHLPGNRELLGHPGEATANPHLRPWIRLRDEPRIRENANRLLAQFQSQPCEFATRVFASSREVWEAIDSFKYTFWSKTDYNNPDWIDAKTEQYRITEEDPDFDLLLSDDEDEACRQLDQRLLERNSPDVMVDLGIRDKRHGITVAIRDVGTGISQIAPVLVHAVAEQDKVIVIEQPEIHIHPALQAELGDVFIESALGDNKNTFLLETHSEHLILRLLRRVRETTEKDFSSWPEELKAACPDGIRPEDIAVLYVQPGDEGAEIIELPVTADGDFSRPWPGGFFSERSKELF